MKRDRASIEAADRTTATAPRGEAGRAALGGLVLALGLFALPAVSLAADDCTPDGTGTKCTLTVGGSQTGDLGSDGDGDTDWFAIDGTNLKPDTEYRFRQIGSQTDTSLGLSDPYARVRNSNSDKLYADDNSGANSDAQVTRKGKEFPDDIFYWVADYNHASGSGTYRVGLEEIIGDCPAKIHNLAECELKPGSTLGAAVDQGGGR